MRKTTAVDICFHVFEGFFRELQTLYYDRPELINEILPICKEIIDMFIFKIALNQTNKKQGKTLKKLGKL